MHILRGVRLRRSDVNGPGYRRRRAGRGFAYYDDDGALIKDDRLDRIRGLAIPPAWQDVWICPWPNGHIQATGVDAAGRRQYRYHDQWRARRDAEKHERVLEIAHQLPDVRDAVVAGAAHPRAQPRAGAGHRRSGCWTWAPSASAASSTRRRTAPTGWPRSSASTCRCAASGRSSPTRRRAASSARSRSPTGRRPPSSGSCSSGRPTPARTCSPTRLDDGEWRDVTSAEINAYLKEISGAEITAKDFRTWNATVLMAADPGRDAAAEEQDRAQEGGAAPPTSGSSEQLGNTPGRLQGQLRRPAGGRPLRERGDRRRGAPRGRARPRPTGTPSGCWSRPSASCCPPERQEPRRRRRGLRPCRAGPSRRASRCGPGGSFSERCCRRS